MHPPGTGPAWLSPLFPPPCRDIPAANTAAATMSDLIARDPARPISEPVPHQRPAETPRRWLTSAWPWDSLLYGALCHQSSCSRDAPRVALARAAPLAPVIGAALRTVGRVAPALALSPPLQEVSSPLSLSLEPLLESCLLELEPPLSQPSLQGEA